MTWHRMQIVCDLSGTLRLGEIQADFASIFNRLNAPVGMAMYLANDSGPKSWSVVFSPVVEELAPSFLEQYGTQTCPQPAGQLALMAGHDSQ